VDPSGARLEPEDVHPLAAAVGAPFCEWRAGIERREWNWRGYAACPADSGVRRVVKYPWRGSPMEIKRKHISLSERPPLKGCVRRQSRPAPISLLRIKGGGPGSDHFARAVIPGVCSRAAKPAWIRARSSLLNAIIRWSITTISVCLQIACITPVPQWPGSFRRR